MSLPVSSRKGVWVLHEVILMEQLRKTFFLIFAEQIAKMKQENFVKKTIRCNNWRNDGIWSKANSAQIISFSKCPALQFFPAVTMVDGLPPAESCSERPWSKASFHRSTSIFVGHRVAAESLLPRDCSEWAWGEASFHHPTGHLRQLAVWKLRITLQASEGKLYESFISNSSKRKTCARHSWILNPGHLV